ncbi:MAG: hypothetical protein ACREVE_00845 [Gammaproteobacteria bacterium]
MQATELCAYVLSVDDPWQVKAVDVNQGGLRMDILVAFKPSTRSWLSRTHTTKCSKCSAKLTVNNRSETKVWRHTNLGPLQTYVHVPVPQGLGCSWSECPIMNLWGEPASPFTTALQRQVGHALEHCDSVQSVCRLLDVRMEDLKRYDKVLSHAGARRRASAAVRTASAIDSFMPRAATTLDDIPDASHPKWQRLMKGELNIHVKALGLQMLLARLRMMMLQDLTESQRRAKIGELRNYFVKYHRFVQYELGQLLSSP